MNKSKTFATISLIGLLGCAAPTAYENFKAGKPSTDFPYKNGVTYDTQQQDVINCQVEAAQRVPQQQVVNTTPTFTTPVQTSCNRIGTQTFCNTTGGQIIGGNTYVTDANEGLRTQVFYQCMANKNYRYVDLPACPDGVRLRDGTSNGSLLPLTSRTCYVVTPDEMWYIKQY